MRNQEASAVSYEGDVDEPVEGKVTFNDLGSEVPFDPKKAQSLRDGGTVETAEPIVEHAEGASTDGAPQDVGESAFGQPEQSPSGGLEQGEYVENRFERKVASIEGRLAEITKELAESGDKWALDAEIAEHQERVDVYDELEAEIGEDINRREERIAHNEEEIAGADKYLKKAVEKSEKKYGSLGGFFKRREAELIAYKDERQEDIRKAREDLNEFESLLEDSQAESEPVREKLAEAQEKRRKIELLEAEEAKLRKQLEGLQRPQKEEAANEDWKAAFDAAKKDALDGSANASERRARLEEEQEAVADKYQESLDRATEFLATPEVNDDELDGMTEDELGAYIMLNSAQVLSAKAEVAGAIRRVAKENLARESKAIEEKYEKVDRYFPTWQERIKTVKENYLIKGALSGLKRKILMRMRGAA